MQPKLLLNQQLTEEIIEIANSIHTKNYVSVFEEIIKMGISHFKGENIEKTIEEETRTQPKELVISSFNENSFVSDFSTCPECNCNHFLKIEDYEDIAECLNCGHPCDIIKEKEIEVETKDKEIKKVVISKPKKKSTSSKSKKGIAKKINLK